MSINNSSTVFSDSTQDSLFRIEDESWWFKYRARVIVGLMNLYYQKSIKTVDIGGGNGYTPSVAQKNGFNMSLLEPSEEACRNARKRGLETHAGMLTKDYPSDKEYDQVLLLDVLEHIEDDNGFLNLLNHKMKVGGKLLITVPAYMILWSSEDNYAGHFRRYKEKEIRRKAEANGFMTLYSGYFMQFLFFPILIVRVWMEKMGIIRRQEERTDEERERVRNVQFKTGGAGIVNKVLDILERIEYRRILNRSHIMFGSSVIIVLKKTSECRNQCLEISHLN